MDGATSEQVADIIGSAWREITGALAPVIGQRGVAALYQRSLHLASAPHPWLTAAGHVGSLSDMDLDSLRTEFARRPPVESARAGAALLLSFHRLVGSLIGPALSGQLLDHVWTHVLSGSPAQDPPP